MSGPPVWCASLRRVTQHWRWTPPNIVICRRAVRAGANPMVSRLITVLANDAPKALGRRPRGWATAGNHSPDHGIVAELQPSCLGFRVVIGLEQLKHLAIK